MALPVNGITHLISAYYSFIDPERMKGWVGLVGWPVADGLPTLVVTHQLQVERRTGKVRQSETHVLPLCHATDFNWCLNIQPNPSKIQANVTDNCRDFSTIKWSLASAKLQFLLREIVLDFTHRRSCLGHPPSLRMARHTKQVTVHWVKWRHGIYGHDTSAILWV